MLSASLARFIPLTEIQRKRLKDFLPMTLNFHETLPLLPSLWSGHLIFLLQNYIGTFLKPPNFSFMPVLFHFLVSLKVF